MSCLQVGTTHTQTHTYFIHEIKNKRNALLQYLWPCQPEDQVRFELVNLNVEVSYFVLILTRASFGRRFVTEMNRNVCADVFSKEECSRLITLQRMFTW
jgi:hypothetical protein